MKFITILLSSLSMFFFVPAFAQTADSTYLPWTSAGPATFIPSPAPGTRCGSSAYDARWNGAPQNGPINGGFQTYTLCQGHLPYYSCPAGYYQSAAGESGLGLYFHTCIKS